MYWIRQTYAGFWSDRYPEEMDGYQKRSLPTMKGDKIASGFASLLVNLGSLSLCLYLLFYGPPLS